MPQLELRQLKKYFDTPYGTLHAVDDVSLSIETGKTLGVVGESGCGKSTLGKSLLRLIEPTSGSIIYEGVDLSTLSPKEFVPYRKELQIIFQDPFASVNPRMSVNEIISEPFNIFPELCPKSEQAARTAELMDTVGLAQRYANSYPHELDGGRRQRIGIARALAMDPKLIVCDEPVSALDVSIQAQILNLLMDLQDQRDITYIFITHDLSVVKHISDDICVMYLGQVVEKCDSEELFEMPIHPYTRALLSAIPIPSLHNRRKKILLKGEISSPIDPNPGCRFAVRCPFANETCTSVTPQLVEHSPNHFVACHRAGEVMELTN